MTRSRDADGAGTACTVVIARSASDEAIQRLAQAALDCFADARNDDE